MPVYQAEVCGSQLLGQWCVLAAARYTTRALSLTERQVGSRVSVSAQIALEILR